MENSKENNYAFLYQGRGLRTKDEKLALANENI